MSFDVFVGFFEEGEQARVPVAEILTAFPKATPHLGAWQLWFDDQCCYLYVDEDSEHTTSIMINRPLADSRFWDAVWRVLQIGNAAFYAPTDGPPLIAKESSARHLPVEMDTPRVVGSGAEIAASLDD